MTTTLSLSVIVSRNSFQVRMKMKRPVTTMPPRIIGTVMTRCARRRLMPSIMPASSMAGGTSSMKLFSIQNENGTAKAVCTRMTPI